MKPWYNIKAKTDDVTEVYIYEQIGEDWFGDGIAAKQFAKDFGAIESANINLRINSPGGSVFDGTAIFNAIKRHPATVTAYVDGLAASIASVIALAGDKVVMAKNSLMMIHNAWGMAVGNANEMRDMADTLDKVDSTIIGTYMDKSGKSEDEVRAAMAAETWFTADEAIGFGLADEVGDEMKIAACFDLSKFRNAPQALTAPLGAEDDDGEPVVEPLSDGEPVAAAEKKRLRLAAGRLI
jgi:ATP-dependent Clp endopeptidase proteolytic subunit ClpP